MLVALLYLRIQADSFAITDFYPLKLGMNAQILIFLGFLLAFAVKLPMWPVHTWLPDAHTEAPAGGSVVLAALMLKIGGYGFLRFSLPIVPDASRLRLVDDCFIFDCHCLYWISCHCTNRYEKTNCIFFYCAYGVCYSRCFMIFIIVQATGNVNDAYMSLEGAMVQMISHAFGSGAMFLGVGVLYDRLHSRLIKNFGGIANTMPVFATFL